VGNEKRDQSDSENVEDGMKLRVEAKIQDSDTTSKELFEYMSELREATGQASLLEMFPLIDPDSDGLIENGSYQQVQYKQSSFFYRLDFKRELKAFKDIANFFKVKKRLVADLKFFKEIGGSSLTDKRMNVGKAGASPNKVSGAAVLIDRIQEDSTLRNILYVILFVIIFTAGFVTFLKYRNL